MKIIGLIPARANSKRIKRKNTKKLLGYPLVVWTIKSVKKVKGLTDIYVSTDDDSIIKICKKFNIKAPWKRPKRLCSSKSTSEDAVIHFLNWYEKKFSKIDGLLLLQPTSPFRKRTSIENAIKIFKKNPTKSVVSFTPEIKVNGSIYISSPKNLRKYKSFFKPSVIPLIQATKKESIDIDTEKDWKKAEKIGK